MTIRHGTQPIERDPRDFSFHRTFGAVSSPTDFPDEYNVDAGLTMPDQNADGYPMGCTGYATADLCTDEDGRIYQAPFTYKKTCLIEGHDTTQGCLIRNSLKSSIVYGMLAENETAEAQALAHKRGAYFNVDLVPGLDWFDSIRSAMWLNRAEKRGISIGTPWFLAFEHPILGIAGMGAGDPDIMSWHNWAIKGWNHIAGSTSDDLYLVAKSWQGRNYGDRGWVYFSRESINALMAIQGTGAFTVRQLRPEDTQTIKATLWETVFAFIRRLISLGAIVEALNALKAALWISTAAPQTPAEPLKTPVPATPTPEPTPTPTRPGKTLLRRFCEAIQHFEGKPGDISYRLNNPGNLNFARQPFAKPHVIQTANGPHTFAEFDTMEHGFQALERQVSYVASGECSRKDPSSPYAKAARRLNLADTSDLTILEYMSVYSPTTDGNDPRHYADTLAQETGVPVDTPIKKLLA